MRLADTRAERLAALVLDYSIGIKPNDRLLIRGGPVFANYAILLQEKSFQRGAQSRYDLLSWSYDHVRGLVERNKMKEWQREFERRAEVYTWCNAVITLNCESYNTYHEGIPDGLKRVAEFEKTVEKPAKSMMYRDHPFKGIVPKWNLVAFPYARGARRLGMTMSEFKDFIYGCTIGEDWQAMSRKMRVVKDALDGAKDVHLLVGNPKDGIRTDLHLSLKGRGGEICAGKYNMPDGEVYWGPVEDGINGQIYFQAPTLGGCGGNLIQGISFKVKDGRIVEHDARINPQGLKTTLDVDEGSKGFGEFACGFNSKITRPMKDVLFDEKIGGTIHMAVGASYEGRPLSSGGGKNRSDNHWDLVCDMRPDLKNLSEYPGGEIRVDGKVIQKDGEWLI
ncbi:aminopeptidase [Candidatus Woesearchaeota archaeon]|nr:aminopeptidase [Candidatus Woesearchaeota archaeon]